MAVADYMIGAAVVHFNDSSNGWLNLGNVPNFSITRESETIEHSAVVSGERLIDLTLQLSQKLGFSFAIDEFNAANIDKLMKGNGVTSNVQSGSSISNEAGTAPAILDRSIFTAESNISALVVTGASSTPVFTLNTDYELTDAITGEIKILSSGTIAAGLTLEIDYTSAARTRDKVLPGKTLQVTGLCRVDIQPINGRHFTWIIQNAALRVEGEIVLDSGAFSNANILIDILVDKTTTITEPYGSILIG